MPEKKRTCDSDAGDTGQPRSQSIHPVYEVKGIDDGDDPENGHEQIKKHGQVDAQNPADAHVRIECETCNRDLA